MCSSKLVFILCFRCWMWVLIMVVVMLSWCVVVFSELVLMMVMKMISWLRLMLVRVLMMGFLLRVKSVGRIVWLLG